MPFCGRTKDRENRTISTVETQRNAETEAAVHCCKPGGVSALLLKTVTPPGSKKVLFQSHGRRGLEGRAEDTGVADVRHEGRDRAVLALLTPGRAVVRDAFLAVAARSWQGLLVVREAPAVAFASTAQHLQPARVAQW